MVPPIGRKLISLRGFKGFIEQLNEDEVLVLEYIPKEEIHQRFRQSELVQIKQESEFKDVNYMQGENIVGFWAIEKGLWLKIPKRRKVVKHSQDDAIMVTAVRRPVEDVVISALYKDVPAWDYFTGVINWTTRGFVK